MCICSFGVKVCGDDSMFKFDENVKECHITELSLGTARIRFLDKELNVLGSF